MPRLVHQVHCLIELLRVNR
ncbi:MAG: hypothetical protein HOK75_08385 [Phycisphaerae bacterium]|nr:hypothetical protein [Phycisphaerae bacterium]MBT5410261.1 hypothetical protein [Phycisphaerae bacterium]MBT6164362.1 hypothetical protein [Phycisphaerae bacterium]MBT7657914.1 hypothetical protein [Phycisphaerae bacterium]